MAHKVVALFMCLVLVANAAVPDTKVTDFYKTCIKNCLDDCLPNKNNNHSLCDKLCDEGCVAIEKDVFGVGSTRKINLQKEIINDGFPFYFKDPVTGTLEPNRVWNYPRKN
uniref:VDE lipocalin domain-containing protein n=1 Tax=Fagus sylvatica TaxID=28930 RepID=A0A2N9ETI8_FAGSY